VSKIKLDVTDGVATVAMNDPGTLNAAGLDMVEELIAAFQGLAADPTVRAVILTGEGRGFCSGANLSDPRTLSGVLGGGPEGPDLGLALESLVPDGGLTWLLPRVVGKSRALEMMLLGEDVPAATARDWGMVNRVVPDANLMDEARAIAGRLASGPRSLGLMRSLLWDSLDNPLNAQLEAERRAQTEAGRTTDFMEGVRAFGEKRPARFTGR
jgi:2-(1,2-epoxy-1,2-dihydrophenyl)acetyl-CoA isomerase